MAAVLTLFICTIVIHKFNGGAAISGGERYGIGRTLSALEQANAGIGGKTQAVYLLLHQLLSQVLLARVD